MSLMQTITSSELVRRSNSRAQRLQTFKPSPSLQLSLGTSRKCSLELLSFSGPLIKPKFMTRVFDAATLVTSFISFWSNWSMLLQHDRLPIVPRTVRRYVGLASFFSIPPCQSVFFD